MERPTNPPTFADAATLDLGCPQTSEFFAKCDQPGATASSRRLSRA